MGTRLPLKCIVATVRTCGTPKLVQSHTADSDVFRRREWGTADHIAGHPNLLEFSPRVSA